MRTSNRIRPLIYLIIFVIFGLIGYWMPLVGDDLNWWSAWGTHYFSSGTFLTYDGRYLGDLLVILMTHSKLISFCIYGSCAALITYLVNLISRILFQRDYQVIGAILMAIGLLLAPKDVFRQIWGWHAGFANYVPSIIFPLFFIYLICAYYDQPNKKINFSQSTSFLILLAAILSQFLAEHITLLNCFNDFLLLIFFRRHFSPEFFKKYFRWIFIGNLIGAFLMFINGAYIKLLFAGHDSYRHIDSQQAALLPYLKTFVSHYRIILLLIILLVIILVNFYYQTAYSNYSKLKLINEWLIIDAIVALLPFIVITPFGPRCIFGSYTLIIALLVINLTARLPHYYKILTPLSLLALLFLGFYFNKISLNYYQTNKLSQDYCQYQQTLQRKDFYVINYSNIDYLWSSNMSEDPMFLHFFVGDSNHKIIAVNYEDWQAYAPHYKVGNFQKFEQQIIRQHK